LRSPYCPADNPGAGIPRTASVLADVGSMISESMPRLPYQVITPGYSQPSLTGLFAVGLTGALGPDGRLPPSGALRPTVPSVGVPGVATRGQAVEAKGDELDPPRQRRVQQERRGDVGGRADHQDRQPAPARAAAGLAPEKARPHALPRRHGVAEREAGAGDYG